MIGAVRAELLRLTRWPTMWLLAAAWVGLNLTFGYLLNDLSCRRLAGAGASAVDRAEAAARLAQMLPRAVPVTAVQGMPMIGGALLLILGGLAVGSGYDWGTWKTILTAAPSRAAALAGTVCSLAVLLVGLAVATFCLDLLASALVTATQPGVSWSTVSRPDAVDCLRGLAAWLLVAATWTMAGALVGALTRSPALAVGLSLVWVLMVENLLRGLTSTLKPLKVLTDLLPGTAAGSLAGALGAPPMGGVNGAPGVNTIIGGLPATGLLVVYLAGFLSLTFALYIRRDIAA